MMDAVDVARKALETVPGVYMRDKAAEAIVSTLTASGHLMGWRRIDEAPKDGSEIVVGRPNIKHDDVSYIDGCSGVAFWDEDLSAFCFVSRVDGMVTPYVGITHWWPLPAPPVGEE